jgi:hypothetical protein
MVGADHGHGLIFVSSSQQLFCSFDGTAFLIRALGSPVQVCENRGGAVHRAINFEPGGPLDIFPAALFVPGPEVCKGLTGRLS